MRTTFHKLAIVVLGFSTVLFFQNCSRHSTDQSSGTSSPLGIHEQSLAILGAFSNGPIISYYVKPVAIKFGHVTENSVCAEPPQTVPVGTTNSGSASSGGTGTNSPVIPGIPFPGCFHLFSSDLVLNLVNLDVEDQSGNVMIQLDSSQISALRTILKDAVVAGANDFSANKLPLCSAQGLPDYAVIETSDGQNIELQGLCDGKDLYNYATGQPAGLKDFLDSLANQINYFQIGVI